MTIHQLQEYIGIKAEIKAIEDELNNLYRPIHSPVSSESHSSTPGNPTETSVMKILQLEKKLESKRDQLLEKRKKIEEWLDIVTDNEICAIVRWRYIKGLNWKQTNIKVYGYPDYSYSRKKIERYFND